MSHRYRNQQNAMHSTGPRTPEGKQTSSQNSFTHGVYAKAVLLPHEDEAAYDLLGEQMTEQFEPHTPAEYRLVTTIQESEWRLRRTLRTLRAITVITTDEQFDLLKASYAAQNRECDDQTLRDLAAGHAYLIHRRVFSQLRRDEFHLRKLIDQCERRLIPEQFQQNSGKSGKPVAEPEPKLVIARWVESKEQAESLQEHFDNGTVDEWDAKIKAENDARQKLKYNT